MVKRKRVPQKNDWIAGNAIEPQQWPKLEGAAGVKFDETARGEIQFLVYGLLEGAIQSEAPLDAQRRKQIEKIAARAEELSQSLEALPIFVKLRVDEAIDSHRNGTLLATLNSPPDCHRLGLEAGELAIAIRKLAVSEKKGRGEGTRVRAEIAKHFMARIEQVF